MAGNIRVLALPFSTQIPDRAVSHTFVQPIDCLMSNPRPGDTNRIPGTSGWREGVTAPSLTHQVPVPGCLLGIEPATCSRTPPAGRRLTPASTSETGRKSSARPETPPLTLFVLCPNRVRPRIPQAVTGGLLHRQEATSTACTACTMHG